MCVTLSVALCTYNGARFLNQQLESLAAQTRLPDELVVRDDGSQDGTMEILEVFAARAPFPVRLFHNEATVGSTENFSRALLDCRGEIFVLCDQDDIWKPQKLERLERAFQNPNVGLAFSNAQVMDAEGRDTGRLLWDVFALGPKERQAARAGNFAKILLQRNRVTGMTMALRASWLDLLLPIPGKSLLLHDAWLALLLAAVSDVALIEEPLVFYRQHPSQQIGVRPLPTLAVRPNAHLHIHIAQLKEIYRRLRHHPALQPGAKAAITALPLHIAHIERRLRFPRARLLRLVPIGAELLRGRYHRFSNGAKSAARDLFSPADATSCH